MLLFFVMTRSDSIAHRSCRLSQPVPAFDSTNEAGGSGRSGSRQLFSRCSPIVDANGVVSAVIDVQLAGTSPSRKFEFSKRLFTHTHADHDPGKVPVRILLFTAKPTRFVHVDQLVGRFHHSKLFPTSKYLICVQVDQLAGNVPIRSLFLAPKAEMSVRVDQPADRVPVRLFSST